MTFAPATINLSSFAGQSNVVLSFNFLETSVIARDGYIVVITDSASVPEPVSLSLLSLGVLALRRRRA